MCCIKIPIKQNKHNNQNSKNDIMTKYFLYLMLACCTTSIVAQNKTNEEPYSVQSLSKDAIKNVEVKTAGGSIAVTGVSPSDARIEVYVRANNSDDKLSKEELRKRVETYYNFSVNVSNNKLTATAEPKERNMNWKNAVSISFKIFAPQNLQTDLVTSGGSISLKNLSGSQDFKTSGGSLHVDNLSGKVNGRTSGGSIHVVNSKDDIDLATSGGSIHAENCNGNLRLATSGGSLNLTNLKGNIKANTSGGSIKGSDIEGDLSTNTSGGSINLDDMACSLETGTSGGNIHVSMKSLGKYVRITNSSGSVTLQIPKNKGIDLKLSGDRVSTPDLANFDGKMEKDEVRGKLNGGGIPVTVSGNSKVSLTLR
jgi:hypothetical protein